MTLIPLPDYDNLHLTAQAMIAEVFRQDALFRQGKFGDRHILHTGPNSDRISVLLEEVGEVARELNEQQIKGRLDHMALIKELVQVGACALSWATAAEHERVLAGE